MKNKIILILTVILLTLSIKTSNVSAQYNTVDTVNVKLGIAPQNLTQFNIYSDDGFEIRDMFSNLSLYQSFEKVLTLKLNGRNFDVYDSSNNFLTSIAANKTMKLLSPSGRPIKINNKRYRGYLSFAFVDNQVAVINNVNLEEYLYGVVPREMPSTFAYEALKAQAVAARSYAVTSVIRNKDKEFDLYDTVSSQVYGGFDAERDNVSKAVDETRAQVLISDGNLVNATYSSSNGGFTADANDVWGAKYKYLVSKEDKYSINEPNYNWNFEISVSDLLSGLKKQGYKINNINQVYIKENNASNRVKTVAVKDGANEIIIENTKFKNAIGSNKFKSSMYKIDYQNNNVNQVKEEAKEDITVVYQDNVVIFIDNTEEDDKSNNLISSNTDKIKISGHGWGHGVGLSQWGANNMAKAGLKYDEILKFYYDGAELTNGN